MTRHYWEPAEEHAGLRSGATNQTGSWSANPPVPQPDDAALLARLCSGDRTEEAAALLYARHVDRVRAVCRNQLRTSPEAAEDLVNETFARLLGRAELVRDPNRVGHWLTSVARRACIDERRRADRHPQASFDDDVDIADGDCVEESVVDREAVAALLAGIGVPHADLLRQHYLEDRSLREIAALRGSGYQSVKQQMWRARQVGARWLARNLRTLVPLPLWRWARGPLERARELQPAATAAVLAPLFAAAALLAPSLAPEPPDRVDAPVGNAGPALASERGDTVSGADTIPRLQPTAAPASPAASAVTRVTGGGASAAAPRREQALIQPDLPVPGTKQRIAPPPPERPPDHELSVGTEPTGEIAWVEAYDSPQTRSANETACAAASSAPAVVDCTSNP